MNPWPPLFLDIGRKLKEFGDAKSIWSNKKIQYDSYGVGGEQGDWLECEFFIQMEASDILGLQSTDVSSEGSINRKQL